MARKLTQDMIDRPERYDLPDGKKAMLWMGQAWLGEHIESSSPDMFMWFVSFREALDYARKYVARHANALGVDLYTRPCVLTGLYGNDDLGEFAIRKWEVDDTVDRFDENDHSYTREQLI